MPRPGIRFNRSRFGQEAALGAPPNLRRLGLGVLIVAGCIALVVALAKRDNSPPQSSTGLTERAIDALKGVSQSGVYLGSAKAPGHLVVYGDLTSLRYAQFQEKVLPTLIERYVKPGRLRLQFATVAGGRPQGPDSDTQKAAELAQAAGLQNHLWQFAGAFASQYVGVLDDTTRSQILRSVPGLDGARVDRDAQSSRVQAAVVRNTAAGQAADARGGLALTLDVNRGAMQAIPVVDDAKSQLESIEAQVGKLPARPGLAPGATKTTPAPASGAGTTAAAAPPCREVDTTKLSEPVACTTASARLTLVAQRTELPLPGLRARLTSVETVAATSASGRARNRMRVVVHLRVHNRGDTPLFGGNDANFVYLSLGSRHINEDHHAWALDGSFKQNEPIPPGKTRTGVLHFELAGSDTTYLQDHRAGQIGIRPSETPNDQGKVPVGVISFSTG